MKLLPDSLRLPKRLAANSSNNSTEYGLSGGWFLVNSILSGDLNKALQQGDLAVNSDCSCADAAQFIESRFGIVYHADHVWRVLRRLGWNYSEVRGWVYKRSDRT